jgi:hypothetical protein
MVGAAELEPATLCLEERKLVFLLLTEDCVRGSKIAGEMPFSAPAISAFSCHFLRDLPAKSPTEILVYATKEFGNLDIECFCYGLDALKREITLSPFYLPNVCPMHTAHFCHPFLRPFPFLPEFADARSEDGLNVLRHP